MSRPDHHLRFFTQNLGNLYAEYKNKNLKILPTLSAKTISLENVFFLGDLYATHSTKTEYSPFSILSVFETRSCRESTLTDHPIYFVPRSYEYFTWTYYTSWTFPLCVQIWKILHSHITPNQLSPFPSVLIVYLFMKLGLICFDAKHDLSEELTCGKETNWKFPAIIAIDLISRAKPWLADTVVTFVTSFLSKWIQANPLIGLFTHSTDRQTLNIEKLLTL